MRPGPDRKAAAAVEFGLAAPFVVMLLIALADLGLAAHAWSDVQQSAQAGAHYAAIQGGDAAAVAAIVEGASRDPAIVAVPAPQLACACPTASGLVSAPCTGVCSDGALPGRYMTVHASMTYSPIVRFPGMPASWTLSASATARLE